MTNKYVKRFSFLSAIGETEKQYRILSWQKIKSIIENVGK